jgi:anti-sigma B factor antagonist
MTTPQLLPGELLITPDYQVDGVAILTLAGDLDMATAPALVAALAGVDRAESVVLDLEQLEFVDSHGIHALLNHADTHTVIVARPQPNVARVLALTNARSTLRITDTLEDALAFGSNGHPG